MVDDGDGENDGDSEDAEKDDDDNSDDNMMTSQRTPPAQVLPGRRTRGERTSKMMMGTTMKPANPAHPGTRQGVGSEAEGGRNRDDDDDDVAQDSDSDDYDE